MKTKEQLQNTKYTARVWHLISPQGRYEATLTVDASVSLSWVLAHFAGWSACALFEHERTIAEGKVDRAVHSQDTSQQTNTSSASVSGPPPNMAVPVGRGGVS